LVQYARREATPDLVVDPKIMLRVLVVVFSGDPIITSRRFLRQREIALVYLVGISSDTLSRSLTCVCLIVLWPWLLPVG
jgi:hypothetical protein